MKTMYSCFMEVIYEPNGVYSAILNGKIVGVGWTEADAIADARGDK